MDRDISIRLISINFPKGVRGLTSLDQSTTTNESYILALNENDSHIQQAATFLHEALHIYHQDCEDTKDVIEIEETRNAELIQILKYLTEESA